MQKNERTINIQGKGFIMGKTKKATSQARGQRQKASKE